MVVTGGICNASENISQQTWIIDTNSGQMSRKADMNHKRWRHGITRINDTIYCAGGAEDCDTNIVHNSFEYFNLD